jgi:hypothetical protein
MVQENGDRQENCDLRMRSVCWDHVLWLHAVCHDCGNEREKWIGRLVSSTALAMGNFTDLSLGAGCLFLTV